MTKNRNYSYSDVDMLTSASIVAKSFENCITELSAVRSNYTVAYATDLNLRIASAMETWLGIDPQKVLRNATTNLTALQVPAKRDLAFFKTQIDDDFKKEPVVLAEMLNNLGFTKHLAKVQKGNQEALVQLLFAFKTNMTDGLKQQLVAKGMGAGLIDNIMGYATSFAGANVQQETSKHSTKEMTQEGANALNALFDEVIGICKIASKYYAGEPLKKEQFTFSRVAAKLGGSNKGGDQTPPAVQ